MDVGTAVEPRRLPGVGRPPYLVRILDEVFEALLVEIAQFHGLRQHSAGDQRRHEVDGLAPDDGVVVLDVRRQLDVVLVLPEDKVLSSTPTRSRCRSSTAEVEVRLEDDGAIFLLLLIEFLRVVLYFVLLLVFKVGLLLHARLPMVAERVEEPVVLRRHLSS